jgi:AAA domain/Toprim domain
VTAAATAFERLIADLQNNGQTVIDAGTTAKAQCPAHDDTNPSLSITAIEGRVLIYCHAGCTSDAIVTSLGRTMTDLFDNSRGADYLYPDGRQVHRTPTKQFSQKGHTKGTALFRADKITEQVHTVYVAEGEQDVLAIESAGGVAVCSAMGAGKAHLADWTPLKGKHVTIIQDKDKAGRKHAAEVAAILEPIAESVQIAEAAVGNDAADHIAAGKTLDELIEHSLLDELSVTGEWLDSQTFAPLEYMVPELLPEGFGYLGGAPKKGKSFLVGNIALAVASGGLALGRIRVKQRPVLILALEDGHRRLQDRFRKMSGNQPLPAALTLIIRATPLEALAVIAEYLQRHRDAKPLVILDTLGKVKRGKLPGEGAYEADYAISSQLKALADAAPGSTLLVVHHIRKAAAEDFVETISGTYGIAGAADYVMVLQRSRGSDDAVLHVTARDIPEVDYALYADDGILWRLNGKTLAESRDAAENISVLIKLEQKHGRLAVKVWHYVNDDQRIVTPAEVAAEFDLDAKRASEILARLANDGSLTKLGRGEYGPG